MAEWEKVKVGDIGKVITGKTPKTYNSEYYDGNIPFLTPSDDMSVKYVRRTNKYITELGRLSVKNATLPANAICVSCIGSDLGKVVITTQETVTNQQINSIVVDTDKFDIDFVYYSMLELGKVLNFHSKTSTAVPIVNKSSFSQYEIDCPKLNTQKRIGAILSSIDKKIEENNRINNNLEQQAKAIFKSWFVDFELNYGVMPSDWKVSQLGSIVKISTEVFSPVKNPNVEVEHYSIPAYDEKRYPIFETSNGIKSNKYRLSSNSVMISKLNPDTKRIWRPYCISDNPICSTEFIVYEPINPLNRDFIYSIIDSIGFSAFLCSHTTGSTNSRQRATPSITLTYDIVVPDEKTIQAFCSIVSPMYDTIENNIKENQKLAETRDKLLPKLMSGELDVSDIDL